MKRVAIAVVALGMLCLAPNVNAQGWDYEMSKEIPLSNTIQGIVINPCVDPPQVIEDFTGLHHVTQKWRREFDKDSGDFIGWEGQCHTNHQNGGATGYDVVVDADGNIVWENGQPVKAVDEDGNFITTEYEIPGTYNWGQRVNENDKDGDQWNLHETFMCMLISHGKAGNALLHFNGHTFFTEADGLEHYTDNYWCKCAGAGPDKNGVVDCDQFGDFCQEPSIQDGNW